MKLTLRRFNNFLTFIVVAVAFYIFLAPFIPEIQLLFADKSPESKAPYAGRLADLEGSDSDSSLPEDNRIVIPTIALDEPIKESSSISAISDGGTWRRPNSATPKDVNNTVIVGHRFFGSNVSTFYHLDKVNVGNTMAVYWDGKEHLYQVYEKEVVPATATDIESETSEKILTIYTCDPVWTGKDRLVLKARPV